VHDRAEDLDGLLGDLFLPAAVLEGQEVEEGVEGLGDVGLAEPAGEGEEGDAGGSGEGGGVGAADEGLEERLLSGGEGGR
jgi:hypothetical protein